MGVRPDDQAGVSTARGKEGIVGWVDARLELCLPQYRTRFPSQHSPHNVGPPPPPCTQSPRPCGPHGQNGKNLSNQMNPNCHLSNEETEVQRRGQLGLELSYSCRMALVLPARLSPSPSCPGVHLAMAGAWLELGVAAGAGEKAIRNGGKVQAPESDGPEFSSWPQSSQVCDLRKVTLPL